MTEEDAFRAARNLSDAGAFAVRAAVAAKHGLRGEHSKARYESLAIASMQSAADSLVNTAVQHKCSGVNPKDAIGAAKVPMGYFPPAALLYATLGMWNGGVKYNPYNWREGGKVLASIYIDAVERHLALWKSGEETADSGVPHLGHALAGLAILVDAFEGGYLVDDRPKHQYDFGALLEQWNAKAPELLALWDSQRKPAV